MTAELLRRAAAKIRETATASYPGPWRWDENYGRDGDTGLALTNDAGDEVVGAYNYHCCDFRDDPTVRDQEKAHIALWSPDVAELMADWLGDIANHWEQVARHAEDPDDPVDDDGWRLEDTLDSYALTLARRILGEQP